MEKSANPDRPVYEPPPQKSLPPPTVPAGEEKKEEEEQLKRGVQITGRKVEKRGWEKTAAFLVCVGETPLCGFSDFGEMVLGDGEGGRESTIAGRLFNFPPFSFDPPLLFPRAHRKKWRRKQEGEFLQELKKAL